MPKKWRVKVRPPLVWRPKRTKPASEASAASTEVSSEDRPVVATDSERSDSALSEARRQLQLAIEAAESFVQQNRYALLQDEVQSLLTLCAVPQGNLLSLAQYSGMKLSVISNSEIRYQGILHSICWEEKSMTLETVRCFGTEQRKAPRFRFPLWKGYQEYVSFPEQDIKSISFDGEGSSIKVWPPQNPIRVRQCLTSAKSELHSIVKDKEAGPEEKLACLKTFAMNLDHDEVLSLEDKDFFMDSVLKLEAERFRLEDARMREAADRAAEGTELEEEEEERSQAKLSIWQCCVQIKEVVHAVGQLLSSNKKVRHLIVHEPLISSYGEDLWLRPWPFPEQDPRAGHRRVQSYGSSNAGKEVYVSCRR
ncbi:unnamed protein product [Durusdinium trenchii]|uniref:Lsm14-like N-terminal domain-containing protein n=2 Tax=Durusdinium trenchii TaxID=1381693 RepID=A0ABP0LXT7_9DINO